MKKTLAFILLFTTFFTTYIYAQIPKSFPEDGQEFVTALNNYLASNNRPESKEVGLWLKTNLFNTTSPEDFKTIQTTTNLMLQKRIPLWPGFYNYAQYLRTTGTNTDLDAAKISKNHALLLQLLQSDSSSAVKDFTNYYTYLVESYKSKALYSDKSKSWYSSQDYSIEMENNYPVYVFKEMELNGVTSGDSLQIKETSGKFYPFTHLWKGNSGKVTWRRAGYNEDEVFATFGKYELDLSKPELKVDTASFQFKPYVDAVIQGKFEDILSPSKSVASKYPQFTSFDKVKLKISDNVKLSSGIGVENSKLYATATGRAEPALLTIINSKNQKILEAEAQKYYINNFQQIDGVKTKVNFAFLDSNISIFHPSSVLSYNLERKNLKITRDNSNDARIPFIAPFFKMIIYVDQFDWNIDSSYADLNNTAANAKLPTYFESFEYYVSGADSKYQQLIGLDPIGTLASYCESMGYNRLSIDEIARAWNKAGYKSIEQLIFKMMEDGYLYYDRETGMVDVYEKLFLHNSIRKDEEGVNYDNIKLSSVAQGKVGRLLLDQKKIEIYGAENTSFSNKANITMHPTSDTVYISENRGVTFKGRLSGGKFNFYADSIEFNYDENAFNFREIDSMLIMVPLEQTDSRGNQYYTEINTPIEKISGKLYMSDPKKRNESVKYTKYPYFVCNDTSKVLFNKSKFADRYPADEFYFNIFPFEIENMNTTNTDSIQFKGELVSGGIFDNKITNLSITKDRTLGLQLNTDKEGFQLFKDKGKFYGHLQLDFDGMTVRGRIEKENLIFDVDSALVLPDSIHADLSKWEAVQKDSMVAPILQAPASTLSWNPINDSIFIKTKDSSDIVAYQQKASINGDYQLYNNQLLADGVMKIDETTLKSDSILLKIDNSILHHLPLSIIDNSSEVFNSPSTNIDIDFPTSTAHIEVLDDSRSRYTYNNLVSNNNKYEWNFAKNNLSTQDDTASNKYFEFENNQLQGIRLQASSSLMDIPTKTIQLQGVSQILVADSKIIPHKEELFIHEGGVIDNIDSAKVVLQADSNFHTIMNAHVDLKDKNHMSGQGSLTLEMGQVSKKIDVESFQTVLEETDTKKKKDQVENYYVSGKGIVEETDSFKLSSHLNYKGDILFNSTSREMQLNGFAQPIFKSIPETDWFKISQSLDLNKTSLKIDSLKNELGQDIYTGFMLDLNEFYIYPRIIQSKITSTDRPIYVANGFVNANDKDSSVVFGSSEALSKQTDFTPYMKYYDNNGNIEAVGEFPIVRDIEPNKFSLFGKTLYQKDSSFIIQHGALAIDLYLPSSVKELLTRFMTDLHFNGKFVQLSNNKTANFAISRLFGDFNKTLQAQQDIESSGMFTVPDDFPYNFVFSDAQFTYDPVDVSFKSIQPLKMLIFAGKTYAQHITGYLELGPRNTHDYINMYFKTASEDWLFMRYSNGELSIISSDANFNNSLSSLKDDQKSLKSGKEIVYKIVLSNPAIKDNFVIRMEEFKDSVNK